MKLSKELLTYDIVKSNIEEIYQQVTLQEYQDGLRWYTEAHSFCEDVSKQYNVPLLNICGVVSALSPQKEWNHNKHITHLYLQGISKHTKVQIEKANRIIKSSSFAEISNHLGGNKTRNFFGNLMYPKDPHFVCLDRHMVKVCTGLYVDVIRGPMYNRLKSVFKDVSLHFGLLPVELQGITWLTEKRVKIKYNKRDG